MSSPLTVSLFLCSQLFAVALAAPASMLISEQGTLQSQTDAKHKPIMRHHSHRSHRRHHGHHSHHKPFESVKPDRGLLSSGANFVKAPVGQTYCPSGTALVNEANLCGSAARSLGIKDMSTTPVYSSEWQPLPSGCFTANSTVYFGMTNGTDGKTCKTCSLVCETIDEASDTDMFEPVGGDCKCGGPADKLGIKQMELQKETVQLCLEQCVALKACDAFEVDEPFNKRCTIWTGACNATASEATGNAAVKCYIRKDREAGATAKVAPAGGN